MHGNCVLYTNLGIEAEAVGAAEKAIAQAGSNAATEATGAAEEVVPVLFNKVGQPYPKIPDIRTGNQIPAPPQGLTIIPKNGRVVWDNIERSRFIKEWYDRGLPAPPKPWVEYDIHHIIPRECGGNSQFENLVPVLREQHQKEFNAWWGNYGE